MTTEQAFTYYRFVIHTRLINTESKFNLFSLAMEPIIRVLEGSYVTLSQCV